MAGFMLQTEGRTWGLKSDVLCLKIRARFFVAAAAATWWAEGAVVLSSWQVWMKTTAGSLCRCSLKNKADRLVHSWQKQGEGVCLHSWGVVLIRKVLAGGGTSSWWPSVTPCVCVWVWRWPLACLRVLSPPLTLRCVTRKSGLMSASVLSPWPCGPFSLVCGLFLLASLPLLIAGTTSDPNRVAFKTCSNLHSTFLKELKQKLWADGREMTHTLIQCWILEN